MHVRYQFGEPKSEFGSVVAALMFGRLFNRNDERGVGQQTEFVQASWRKRLWALQLPEDLYRVCNRAYNCGPSFVACEPQPLYRCGRAGFCPFCYARRISKLSRRVWQALHKAEVPAQLATQRQQLLLPYTTRLKQAVHTGRQVDWLSGDDLADVMQSYRELCHEFNEPRYWRTAYQTLGRSAQGAAFVCTIEPGQLGWIVSLAKAVVLPVGEQVRWPALRGRRLQAAVKRGTHPTPTVRSARRILAALFTYPNGWLRWPKLKPSLKEEREDYSETQAVDKPRLLPLEAAFLETPQRLSGLYGSCRRKQPH